MRNLAEYATVSGGRALELAASKADNPLQFNYVVPLLRQRNCNFSFAGLHNQISRMIEKEEKIHGE